MITIYCTGKHKPTLSLSLSLSLSRLQSLPAGVDSSAGSTSMSFKLSSSEKVHVDLPVFAIHTYLNILSFVAWILTGHFGFEVTSAPVCMRAPICMRAPRWHRHMHRQLLRIHKSHKLSHHRCCSARGIIIYMPRLSCKITTSWTGRR